MLVSQRNMTACSGSIDPPEGCVMIPIVSDSCIDFVGGLTFLNKEVSWVQVPSQIACTLFQRDAYTFEFMVTLTKHRTRTMFDVPAADGTTQKFNDLASSVSCFPFK
jgi:hypothetical protein